MTNTFHHTQLHALPVKQYTPLGKLWMEMGKDVHVIFYTIDLIEVTFFMIQYPPDIFKKLMPVISRHDGISAFCTEHNLIEYLGIRAHEFIFVEPRCGSGFTCPTHAPDYIRSYLKFNPFGI